MPSPREIVGEYQLDNLGSAAPLAELADRTEDERGRLGYSKNDPSLRSGECSRAMVCDRYRRLGRVVVDRLG